jgi:hypothetical protein
MRRPIPRRPNTSPRASARGRGLVGALRALLERDWRIVPERQDRGSEPGLRSTSRLSAKRTDPSTSSGRARPAAAILQPKSLRRPMMRCRRCLATRPRPLRFRKVLANPRPSMASAASSRNPAAVSASPAKPLPLNRSNRPPLPILALRAPRNGPLASPAKQSFFANRSLPVSAFGPI